MKTMEEKFDDKIEELDAQNGALLGIDYKKDNLQHAEQFRKAVQLFANSLLDTQALEIATIYPKYETDKSYLVGDFFAYGVNFVGDPQLYKVVQAHTSQSDWLPSETPSLYEPIGLNNNGYPIWSQPSGAHDAYNAGDIVDYNGTLYKSLIDGNVYSPETYPAGWEVVTEDAGGDNP